MGLPISLRRFIQPAGTFMRRPALGWMGASHIVKPESPVNFKVISGDKFSKTYHYDFSFRTRSDSLLSARKKTFNSKTKKPAESTLRILLFINQRRIIELPAVQSACFPAPLHEDFLQ